MTTAIVTATQRAHIPEMTPAMRFPESCHQVSSSWSDGSCGTSMTATVMKRATARRAAAAAATFVAVGTGRDVAGGRGRLG